MDEERLHQIGEAARRAGLSFRTVRYYEEVGLVVPSGRTVGGFRLYTDADMERLSLIKQLKPLKFSLEELRDLLDTRDRLLAGVAPPAERAALAARLARYAETADERCRELRSRLGRAEAVTAALLVEARAANGRVATGRPS